MVTLWICCEIHSINFKLTVLYLIFRLVVSSSFLVHFTTIFWCLFSWEYPGISYIWGPPLSNKLSNKIFWFSGYHVIAWDKIITILKTIIGSTYKFILLISRSLWTWICWLFWQRQAKELEVERDSIVIEEEESLEKYYSLIEQYKSLKKDVRDIVVSPRYCLPFLQPGRLVSINCTRSVGVDDLQNSSDSFSIVDPVTWGVIINFERVKGQPEGDNCFF